MIRITHSRDNLQPRLDSRLIQLIFLFELSGKTALGQVLKLLVGERVELVLGTSGPGFFQQLDVGLILVPVGGAFIFD